MSDSSQSISLSGLLKHNWRWLLAAGFSSAGVWALSTLSDRGYFYIPDEVVWSVLLLTIVFWIVFFWTHPDVRKYSVVAYNCKPRMFMVWMILIGALVGGILFCLFGLSIKRHAAKQQIEPPVPLTIKAIELIGERETGLKVAGIEWKSEYKDLRVAFGNPTDNEYKNIDLQISVNVPMAAIDQFTRISGVTVIPPVTFGAGFTDKDGKIHQLSNVEGGFNQVRVLCEKLPKHAEVEMVLAISPPPWDLSRKLKGIYVEGTYEADGISRQTKNTYWVQQFPPSLPPSPAPPAKTLYDILLSDCKAAGAELESGTRVLYDNKTPVYKIGYVICADYATKTKYVSFFLPESNRTFPAASHFLPFEYQSIMGQTGGKAEKTDAELKDSRRILIYHETYIFPERIKEAIKQYEAAGWSAEFRAKDLYENERIIPVDQAPWRLS